MTIMQMIADLKFEFIFRFNDLNLCVFGTKCERAKTLAVEVPFIEVYFPLISELDRNLCAMVTTRYLPGNVPSTGYCLVGRG